MISAALGRIPNHTRVELAAYALIPFATIGGLFLGLNLHTVTVTQTKTVAKIAPIRSVADIQTALGAPQGTAQLANGKSCPGWRLPDGIVLVCQ